MAENDELKANYEQAAEIWKAARDAERKAYDEMIVAWVPYSVATKQYLLHAMPPVMDKKEAAYHGR